MKHRKVLKKVPQSKWLTARRDINQNVINHAHTHNDKMGCFILLFYFLTVRNVFTPISVGLFRDAPLWYYVCIFFFFAISAQVAQNTKCILVSQIVLELSLLYVALHIFFFHVPTCSLSKIGRAVLDRNSPVFKYIRCTLDSFLTYICRSSFFMLKLH